MASSGGHLLSKRILFLNSDDAIADNGNSRDDLYIPIPQQMQDPASQDLVYKMWIQDVTIPKNVPNVNGYNVAGPQTVTMTLKYPLGPNPAEPTLPLEYRALETKTFSFPAGSYDDDDFAILFDQVFGGLFTFNEVQPVTNPDPAQPGQEYIVPIKNMQLEWTNAAKERRVYNNARDAIDSPNGPYAGAFAPPVITWPSFSANGNNLMVIIKNVIPQDNNPGWPGMADQAITDAMRMRIEIQTTGLGFKLLGAPDNNKVTLVPMFAKYYPTAAGYVRPTLPLDPVTNPIPEYTSAQYAAVKTNASMPIPMIMDDMTELHIMTDLPTHNCEIVGGQGLKETRATALVPVNVPNGGTISWTDVHGINAAYERNISTISRLHIYLLDKYNNPYEPLSAWSFTLAIETLQDDFKRMLDILIASNTFHETAVNLHKMQLVGSSFNAYA